MSYQQQNWQSGGYPQQGYNAPQQPQHDFDSYRRQGSPILPMLSALLGLGIAGALTWQTLDLLKLISDADATDAMPGGWRAMIIGHFAVAGIAFIGVVLVFARKIAGAFILMASAVLTVGGLLTAPFYAEDIGLTLISGADDLAGATSSNAVYFGELVGFEFDNTQLTLRFVALAAGVLLLLIAVLPPSLNWLRKPREDEYSAQQAGW